MNYCCKMQAKQYSVPVIFITVNSEVTLTAVDWFLYNIILLIIILAVIPTLRK